MTPGKKNPRSLHLPSQPTLPKIPQEKSETKNQVRTYTLVGAATALVLGYAIPGWFGAAIFLSGIFLAAIYIYILLNSDSVKEWFNDLF